MTPKLSVLGIAMFFCFQSFSQAIEKELPDQDWRTVPALPNENLYLVDDVSGFPLLNGDYSAGQVMVSPDEAVVLSVYRKEYSVRKLNNKLQVKWNTPLSSTPLFIGRINGNIIVICSPEIKNTKWVNSFDAILLDPNSGKIINRKNIYKGSEDYFNEPKFLVSAKGDQVYFGVRETALTKGVKVLVYGIGAGKVVDNYNTSRQLSFYAINDRLDITATTKIPLNESDIFINCGLTTNKELVIASNNNTDIKVETFDPNSGKSLSKVIVGVDARDEKRSFSPSLLVSKIQPDLAYISIEYLNKEKDRVLGNL